MKYSNSYKITIRLQLQPQELLHYCKSSDIKPLQRHSIECIISNLTLKLNKFLSCFDYCLNLLQHNLYQIIPPIVHKVISNTDNYFFYNLLRCNISIFLQNYILYICLSIFNWIKIRRIQRVPIALHFQLFSDRNAHLIRRNIVFYNN